VRRLREHGIEATVRPFFRSDDVAGFYSRRAGDLARRIRAGLHGLARRVGHVSSAGRFDLVLVHREILPRGNRAALRLIRRTGTPMLYDLDDAVWLSPRDHLAEDDPSRRKMVRFKDPTEIDDLIRGADRIAAGSPVLADHCLALNDRVDFVPTPVDTSRLRPRDRAHVEVPVVGWIGSPTATYCLREILPALRRVALRRPFVLRVVGAGETIELPGVRVENLPWSLEREPEDLATIDVGLYPLPDNPWTRGKCGFKALQYFAAGAATVLSPVGVGADLAGGGERALEARTAEDWESAVERLVADASLRRSLADEARRWVVARYSYEVVTPKLARSIRKTIEAS
jgi:glycosyltransferase involved in cell wall biosynthesis